MKLTATIAAASALAAGLLIGIIIADPPADEVSGTPVAAPTNTVLTTVVHRPGPGDPECIALAAKKAAAREAGLPGLAVPTELLGCDPHTFR